MAEREETTLDEAIRRLENGSFFNDYDYAAGPGLRALRRAAECLEAISSAAVCLSITSPAEHADILQTCYAEAERGLGRG